MALKYNVEYNNIAKIGDREFRFRPWTTKNEKDYLISVESEEKITDEMLFDILIRPCLENSDVTLTVNEQKMLMIEIRKKSLGSTFPMKYICRECKQVNDLDVELDKIINFSPDKFEDVCVEDLVFSFGHIATQRLKDRLKEQNTDVDYSFTEFLLHIQSIEISGRIEDTFTFDELKDFVESLPTFIFDEVFEKFKKMKSSLEFSLRTYCMVCNTENDIEFDTIPNFLWT